jgi:hypothetical protein
MVDRQTFLEEQMLVMAEQPTRQQRLQAQSASSKNGNPLYKEEVAIQ